MTTTSPSDKVRSRTVKNYIKLISEHLEAMQRDSHGLEYDPWKKEVDFLWKQIFSLVNLMNPSLQKTILDSIREPWTSYITHYGIMR
tara:strand:- start:131 stop:391 length:261 start_codon:yes stop_codon:yes gene_type:complete